MPSFWLLSGYKFENEGQKLKKTIKGTLNKNKISWHSIRAEELPGEHQLKPEDAKKVRLKVLKFLSGTKKDIEEHQCPLVYLLVIAFFF